MRTINLGNANFRMEVQGADEALEKLNLLQEKLKEVNSLINEITSSEVKISFFDSLQQEDDSPCIQH